MHPDDTCCGPQVDARLVDCDVFLIDTRMAVPIFLIIVPVVFFLFLALSIGLSVGLRGRCGFNSGRGGYRRGVVLPLAIASQQQRQQQAGHQGQVSYIGANQGVPRG